MPSPLTLWFRLQLLTNYGCIIDLKVSSLLEENMGNYLHIGSLKFLLSVTSERRNDTKFKDAMIKNIKKRNPASKKKINTQSK